MQSDQVTVQGEMESVLKSIFSDQKISLVGAGRTDSGVHALGQVANVKIDTHYGSNDIKNISPCCYTNLYEGVPIFARFAKSKRD